LSQSLGRSLREPDVFRVEPIREVIAPCRDEPGRAQFKNRRTVAIIEHTDHGNTVVVDPDDAEAPFFTTSKRIPASECEHSSDEAIT
jgi:hypothetical protein